jgi:hypothetical protein
MRSPFIILLSVLLSAQVALAAVIAPPTSDVAALTSRATSWPGPGVVTGDTAGQLPPRLPVLAPLNTPCL